jgi:large subunit ribosomal protein L20
MRVKSSVYTRQRKKKVFRITKGYYSNRNNRWRQAIQQVDKSLKYAYRDRKDRKGEFRQLWITRINAATNLNGLSYSKFISGLKKSNILLNRKMLAELAIHDAPLFQKIVEQSKAALGPH